MSKESESNLNEMANIAGSGEGLALPPAFVFVNPKSHRKYKKGNQDKVDGRTKGARSLLNRIQPVSYTHLRAHETRGNLVCRLLLEKKK